MPQHDPTPRCLSRLVLLAATVLSVGCSGGLPSLAPGGYVVSPAVVISHTGNDSLSTVWYHGSDSRFHHFSHLVKVSTKYRVRRAELSLDPDDEFTVGSQKPVFADPMLRRALKNQNAEQAGAGQPATRFESDSEGSHKPQPESEGRSR